MTTQKQFIESKLSEFVKELESIPVWDHYHDEQSTADSEIGEIGVAKLKYFLSTALKEIVEEHFKEIMVEKFEHSDFCHSNLAEYCDCNAPSTNQAIDQITSRHNKYLS